MGSRSGGAGRAGRGLATVTPARSLEGKYEQLQELAANPESSIADFSRVRSALLPELMNTPPVRALPMLADVQDRESWAQDNHPSWVLLPTARAQATTHVLDRSTPYQRQIVRLALQRRRNPTRGTRDMLERLDRWDEAGVNA